MNRNVFKFGLTLVGFISALMLLGSCAKDDADGPIAADPTISAFIGEISADSLKANAQWLQNLNSRFALNDNRRLIALKIKKKFESYGSLQVKLDSFFLTCEYDGDLYETWQYNVVVTLPGSIHPDSLCIMGAHYDCILDDEDPTVNAPGANDNASGVAAILEIARVMKHHNYAPRTTIELVAFAAEELDLYGSADYATKVSNSGKKVSMMLNADMIAYEPSADPDQWKVNIMNYDNSEELQYRAVQVANAYTSLTPVNDNTWIEEGDSFSFYQRGFEAVFFICNSDDPYYHTANDVTARCNFAYCREVAKLSCAMLLCSN